MWSVLVFAVTLFSLGSGSPIWISSPISTGGRPLVSVLAVPEARARLVGEIEGLIDELNLPCTENIRTTMFVALLRLEGQRIAMESARFNDMAVTPLLAKLDTPIRERLTEAIRALYTEVLERPIVNEVTWYKGLTNTKESCVFVKTFATALHRLERTLYETPETVTVGEVKRTLMTVMSELKGLRDCSVLVSPEQVTDIFTNIMARLTDKSHIETAMTTLEAEINEIIRDPAIRNYIRGTLETMATKSASFMAYMLTSLNTMIHSGTRPTEILVNWLYTLSTMMTGRTASPNIYNMMEAIGANSKPESMRWPYARFPSASSGYPWYSRYSSSFPSFYPSRIVNPFRPSYPSMKYPIPSAYLYGLPISALPYPSPFPAYFMDSHPIPSGIGYAANKLYSAPYMFALGSGRHLKMREALMSASTTMDMARSIELPSPADPCYSQKVTAINAILVAVHNSVDYSAIRAILSQLHNELASEVSALSSIKGYPMRELLNSPSKDIIISRIAKEVLKPGTMAVERLYNIPELRPILSHYYALFSSVIQAPAPVVPKLIAAVLKEVAEVIRTDDALCRLDVSRVVPEIEEVLTTVARSLSWEAVESKVISGLKECLVITGLINEIPDHIIYRVISKVKPVYHFRLRHHTGLISNLMAALREGRARAEVVSEILVALEEINMAADVGKLPVEAWMYKSSKMAYKDWERIAY